MWRHVGSWKLVRYGLWGLGVVAAVGVWVVPLDQPPLWTDEWYSLLYSSSFRHAFADTLHPPFYYLLLFLWRQLPWPDPLVAGRLLSVLLVGVAVLLWRWVLRNALPGEPFAHRLAVLLMVFSPYMVLYGRMVRYFSLAAVLVALAVGAFWQWYRTRLRHWVFLAALSHLALAFVDVPNLLIVLVAETAFLYGMSSRPGTSAHLLVSWIAVGATALTLANLAAPQMHFPLSLPTSLPNALMRGAVGAGFPVWSVVLTQTVSPAHWPLLLATLTTFFLLIGFLVSHHAELPAFIRLAGVTVGVTLVILGVMAVFARPRHIWLQTPKLFFPFAPLVYTLIAYAVAKLRSARARGLVLVALWLIVPIGLYNYKVGREFLYPNYALPWDKAAEIVAAQATPEDVVLVSSGPFEYYYKQLGGKAPLRSELPPNAPLKPSGRIWMVTKGASLLGPSSTFALGDAYQEQAVYQLGTLDPTLQAIGSRLLGYPIQGYLLRVSLYVHSSP